MSEVAGFVASLISFSRGKLVLHILVLKFKPAYGAQYNYVNKRKSDLSQMI